MSGMRYEKDGYQYIVPSVDVTEVYNEAHGIGKAEGKAEGEAECKTKHFAAIVTGDGTGSITFGPVPFDPDVVEVICFKDVHKDGAVDDIVQIFTCDLRANASNDRLCGMSNLSKKVEDADLIKQQNARTAATLSTANISSKLTIDADRMITVQNVTGYDGTTKKDGTFGLGCEYICTAVKVTE